MRFKIGDKVRVRSGLQEVQLLGISLETYHKKLENNVFTITGFVNVGRYTIEEMWFILSDEMLEPIEEFNVGDEVYTDRGDKVTLLEPTWLVKFGNRKIGYRGESQLTHQKPLQKITREALAKMGYELED